MNALAITYIQLPSAPQCMRPSWKPQRSLARDFGRGKADPVWDIALQPKLKHDIHRSDRAPLGTAKPYLPASFVAKDAEYRWLIATQDIEMSTVAQELAQAGLASFSLSSSPMGENDDEMEAGNVATCSDPVAHAPIAGLSEDLCQCLTHGTVFTQPDPDLMRRIQWEKDIFACGPTRHVYAKRAADGSRSLGCDSKPLPTREELAAYAPAMRALTEGRDMDDIENARARAIHYGRIVESLMTPDERRAWYENDESRRFYLEVADIEDRSGWDIPHHEVLRPYWDKDAQEWREELVPALQVRVAGQTIVIPAEGEQGPAELGLHTHDRGEDGTVHLRVDDEPNEEALWPSH